MPTTASFKIMNITGHKNQLKKEILVRIIKSFFSDNFEENIRLIPFDMRPKGMEVPYRCCIYKERAIIKDRAIAGLGFPIEDDDDTISLRTYAQKALERKDIDGKNLTVLQAACKGCLTNRIFVTDLCQGCVDRPCLSACKFGAISIRNGKSVIDETKCKKCKMCIAACSYKAIVKITVPCEEACVVGAIKKDETGFASIDYSKCIYCGKCIAACPFGAVHEMSQIIDILKAMKDKKEKKIIALIAPAIAGQFNANIYQIKTALMEIGFDDVLEVAEGADITAFNEAAEFADRMERNEKFMTSSCCAGYRQLIKKHLPEIKPFISDTQTPLYYTAELAKKKFKNSVTIFISPCVAKRAECYENENVDFVMNFEELDAFFTAKEIDPGKCGETKFDKESSKHGRNFGIIGGVTGAIKAALNSSTDVTSYVVNGLNKDTIGKLKSFASAGESDDSFNMVEVMFCPGGCIGGSATITDQKTAKKSIDALVEKSKEFELS
ncbi:MAG: 4Fe-4S binding protein [Elusimicrobia bacterium]|nr:4Fe-4S binding protein [Elusimicrobiota bacterium]